MAFNQSLTFELRQPRTAFVGLGPPHALYGFVAGLPEAGDEPGMVFEMTIEDAPLSSRGPFHGVDSSLGEAPLAHLVPNRHDPLLSLIAVLGRFTALGATKHAGHRGLEARGDGGVRETGV